MKISQFYQSQKQTISFEFFPPKTPEAEDKLFETIGQLKELHPSFVSVTYGAMGNTRAGTLRIVSRIKKEHGIEAAAHLTCVGQTRDEIKQVLQDLKDNDIENIVALRGDPPKGETEFKPVPGGLTYASELVGFIRSFPEFKDHFNLAVAGYPEVHMQCRPDAKKDLENLKYKVDQGADAIITQLFFNNEHYFKFVEDARAIGINMPIVPGIMPLTMASQIERFGAMCGAEIPQGLIDEITSLGDDKAAVEACGIDFATKQCQELLDKGAPGLHFYTLNKSKATREIYTRLKLVPK